MRDLVQLDLLIKASEPPDLVTAENVARARPDPGLVERCRRWLAERGLTCHATDFGVVCSGEPADLARVFGSISRPRAPPELAAFVDQVTVTEPPELF